MQGQSACRAGDPSGQGKDPSSEGLGGHDLLTQADAGCPAGQVVRHHLYRQPGAVGGEAARGEMVQPHAVLEVAYRILDLGVAAVVGLQLQGFPVPVEAVIAVDGEESQLRTGRRFTRRTMSRTGAASASAWNGVQVVSATSAAPSIQ